MTPAAGRAAVAALAVALVGCGPPDDARAPAVTGVAAPARSRPVATAPATAAAPAPSTAPPAASAPPEPPIDELEPSLPAGFVRVPSDPETVSAGVSVACGSFRVENVRGDPAVWEPSVRAVGPTGRTVYEARGRRYDVDAGVTARMSLVADVCGDLTGDGVPELILTERTLGAHCCYTHYVVTLTSPTRNLLMWDKGDGGHGLWPARLQPGAAWQLRSVDLVVPPFDVEAGDPAVSYSGFPGFPIVFDLVAGAYVKRTFRFADALRAERDAELAACERTPGCAPYVLHAWGMALLAGDWERRKHAIEPDAEARAPLDRRASAMLARMKAQLGR